MQTHNLKSNSGNRSAKQVGRGSKRGKTSGRGTKGQNARSGRKKRPELRDIIKRLPKLRGRGKNSLKSRVSKSFAVALSVIEANFDNGAKLNRQALLAKGLIKLRNGRLPEVKVLADKKPEKKFVFEDVAASGKVTA